MARCQGVRAHDDIERDPGAGTAAGAAAGGCAPAGRGRKRECFSDPWPQAAFQAELDNPYCFYLLAFADGQLAGYIGGVALYENCDVNNLAVLPQMRRRGIAAALLSGFLEEARRRGAGQVMLEVREHNLPAMALYRRFGFSACGKRKNYYQTSRNKWYHKWY